MERIESPCSVVCICVVEKMEMDVEMEMEVDVRGIFHDAREYAGAHPKITVKGKIVGGGLICQSMTMENFHFFSKN